jgi:ABC-type multidrug transport system ATPase subunit
MHINNGECFGFLGPNGAGKSTTINMLSGYLRPSSGTAYINGLDIKEDIDTIRLQLGVCPQENILWDDLTGPEHLYFFGRLKNLRGKKLDKAVDYWMEQVNLTSAKNKFSRQYSGGMKRRLCVAIAFIGNPSVVLLDEPTTGLDPASKQDLWEVVNGYKRKCAMMLTTHSMEEAEALCDRLGIFVGGRLATLGTAQDLKSRYGSGYRLVITTSQKYEESARAFVKQLLPSATLLNTLNGTQQFEVPRAGIKLSKVFKQINQNTDKYNIIDWGISNTTLEEVFLYITDKMGKGASLDAPLLHDADGEDSSKSKAASSSSSASPAHQLMDESEKERDNKSESSPRETEESQASDSYTSSSRSENSAPDSSNKGSSS